MLDIGNDLQNTVSKRTATFVHHWHHYLYHLLTPTHKHSVICPFIHTLLDMPLPPTPVLGMVNFSYKVYLPFSVVELAKSR